MGQLRVSKVRSAGRVSINGDPVTVGRSSENTITLRSSEVSRHHCVIEAADGVTRIRDLGSHHGTKVNGDTVTELVLHHGDRIRIGRFELTFTDPEEADRARIDAEAAQRARCEAEAARQEAEVVRREAEAAGREAEAAQREAEAVQRESEAARREAEAAQHKAEAGQRDAEAQRDDLQVRLAEALARGESLEAKLARQVKTVETAQHETAERGAAADRAIRLFEAHRRQLLDAWQRLAAVHQTLLAVEALWVETEEQTQNAESAAPEELQELVDRREALAERLEAVHAARDAAMGSLQSALQELAVVQTPASSRQPAARGDRRRRGPFRFLGSTGS